MSGQTLHNVMIEASRVCGCDKPHMLVPFHVAFNAGAAAMAELLSEVGPQQTAVILQNVWRQLNLEISEIEKSNSANTTRLVGLADAIAHQIRMLQGTP